MKIVRFLGGLGNQMFQYSFYKLLESRFKDVKADLGEFANYNHHNGYELDKVFNIRVRNASRFHVKLYDPRYRDWVIRKLRRVCGLKNAYFEEEFFFEYNPTLLVDKSSLLYWGYWQNPNYLEPVRSILEKDFQFVRPLDKRNKCLSDEILINQSVAVHIRRGDYLTHSILGGICDLNYYQKSIEVIKKEIKDPHFYIFSNDIDWCRENIVEENITFVDWNNQKDSYKDMQLMSLCKHNIIANSSFSWWAAWLNKKPNKIIIAPSKWAEGYGQSIIPSSWKTI